jgi:thiamine biosynthesis lipoprotein
MIGMAVAAMGTRFELVLEGSRAVGEEALQEIERLHERWTRFESHSFLRFVEREAVRRPVALDAEDWRLFQCALRAYRLSQGAFDVAWVGETGTSADIELDERERTVRFHAPLQLDMGALAKGHALDVAGDVLIERGVTTALLHGGTSSVRAIGEHPQGVRIADHGRKVELSNASLSVSSQALRTHVVDARGRPLPPTSARAWALAATGLDAEAASTLLLMLGTLPDRSLALEYGMENT